MLLAARRVGGISRRRRRVRVMRHADAVHGGEIVHLMRHLALSRAGGVRSIDAGREAAREIVAGSVGLRNDAKASRVPRIPRTRSRDAERG
jgi:hypothetical protein